MLGWTSFYFKLITDKRIGSLGDCYIRLLLLFTTYILTLEKVITNQQKIQINLK